MEALITVESLNGVRDIIIEGCISKVHEVVLPGLDNVWLYPWQIVTSSINVNGIHLIHPHKIG